MDNFKIETSLQLPILKFKEELEYSEVKKPSGIAYIILLLIKEGSNIGQKLHKLLESFGVPHNLHYIFAEEIRKLIDDNILDCEDEFDPRNFESYTSLDFYFTSKGEKVFKDEVITTGEKKNVSIPVFYNIALKELSLNLDPSLECRPLMDSAIKDKFVNQFKCEKDIEDFLNSQKGKGLRIKKEEIITRVEEECKDNYVARYECELKIINDKVEVHLDNPIIQRFVESNYSNEMINETISLKNKFKFKEQQELVIRKIGDYKEDCISEIILPSEIDKVIKQKNKVLITKGNYKSSEKDIISEISINKYDISVEIIIVDLQDNIYGYVPGLFCFNNDVFGDIIIPLVLKLKITSKEFSNLINPYLDTIKEYSEDNFKELVKITSISNNYSKIEEMMYNYLKDSSIEEIIIRLNEMKQYALSNTNILNIYKRILEEYYNKLLDSVTFDNLDTTLKISKSIPNFINISQDKILGKIVSKINTSNLIKIYEVFVSNGFERDSVITFVNPVPSVLKGEIIEEQSLIDLSNYVNAIKEMQNFSSIKDYKNFNYDEDDIDRQKFKEQYNKAQALENRIKFFKYNNEEVFKSWDGFMNLFRRINDSINMYLVSNPIKIKLEDIEAKISKGVFDEVFINLSKKLESLLKSKYKLEGKLSDMLSKARADNLIDRIIVSDLHNFRENRNAILHPEDRNASYSVDDLRRWAKEIFELEGGEK